MFLPLCVVAWHWLVWNSPLWIRCKQRLLLYLNVTTVLVFPLSVRDVFLRCFFQRSDCTLLQISCFTRPFNGLLFQSDLHIKFSRASVLNATSVCSTPRVQRILVRRIVSSSQADYYSLSDVMRCTHSRITNVCMCLFVCLYFSSSCFSSSCSSSYSALQIEPGLCLQ